MRFARKLVCCGLLAIGAPALAQGVVTARAVNGCPAAADALARNFLQVQTAAAYQRFPTNPVARAGAIKEAESGAASLRSSRLEQCQSWFGGGRTNAWTSSLR